MYRSLCLVFLSTVVVAVAPAPAFAQRGHGGGGGHIGGGGGTHLGSGGGGHIGGGVRVAPSQHFGSAGGMHSPGLGGMPQHIAPQPQHISPQHLAPQHLAPQPHLSQPGAVNQGNNAGTGNRNWNGNRTSTWNPSNSNRSGSGNHDRDGDGDRDGFRSGHRSYPYYNFSPYRYGYGGLGYGFGYGGLGYGGLGYRRLGYGGYGYPNYASGLGFGMRPYRNTGYNIIPYYYGYLSGVPYLSVNNYSPAYYSQYSTLPSSTGAVTTYNASPTIASSQSNAVGPAANTNAEEASPSITDSEAEQLLQKSESALASGEYQQAIVDAGKAAYALHEDSRVHEVLWLALLGLSDYRGAAIEAHAVEHFGVTPNWNDVAMMHESPTAFAEQLQKLETFVKRNQDADFAAFLLGYNYLVLGHRDAAKQWLEAALKMDPEDAMCAKLVASLQPDSTEISKPGVGLLPADLQSLTSPKT